MARYRGTLQGRKGTASRLGHSVTGLTATVNGWHAGVTVHARPCALDMTRDEFVIDITRGSMDEGLFPDVVLGERRIIVTERRPTA